MSLEIDGRESSISPSFKPHIITLDSISPTSQLPITTLGSISPTFETSITTLGSITPTFKTSITNPDVLPNFVSEPKDKCVACQLLLWNAFQLPCGHHVCQTDITALFRDKDRDVCPVEGCDVVFTKNDVFPDACKRREISNLSVYCSFKDMGCPVEIHWRNLLKHEASCTFRGKKCDKCGQAVLQSDIQTHIANICEYRDISCHYCTEQICLKAMEDHHESECRRYPLSCPNECGVHDILREQMDSHLDQCPRKKVACTFAKYGCEIKGTETEMAAHDKEYVSVHLDMLVKPLMGSIQQNEVLSKEFSEIENLKKTLAGVIQENARIPQHVEENKKLQKEVQTNKTSIQEMKKYLASNGEKVIQTGRRLDDKASVESVDKLKNEVAVMKDAVQTSNQRMSNIERAGVIGGATGGGSAKVIQQVEKQVGHMDVRLCELDLRLQLQETVNYDGVLMWKIRDYSRRKREATSGKTLSLYSQPFYTSRYGYKLCGRVYLNGDGGGKGSHLSFFLVVMRGDYDALLSWPFQLPISMKILDQNGTYQHISENFMPNASSNSFQRPTSEMNIACGVPRFVLQTKLETETYLKDDTIFLRVVVDSTNEKALY